MVGYMVIHGAKCEDHPVQEIYLAKSYAGLMMML